MVCASPGLGWGKRWAMRLLRGNKVEREESARESSGNETRMHWSRPLFIQCFQIKAIFLRKPLWKTCFFSVFCEGKSKPCMVKFYLMVKLQPIFSHSNKKAAHRFSGWYSFPFYWDKWQILMIWEPPSIHTRDFSLQALLWTLIKFLLCSSENQTLYANVRELSDATNELI